MPKRPKKEIDPMGYLAEVHDRADRGAKYLPTPSKIRQAAARIRAGWSKRELASRCQLPGAEPVDLQPIKVMAPRKGLSGDHG